MQIYKKNTIPQNISHKAMSFPQRRPSGTASLKNSLCPGWRYVFLKYRFARQTATS